MVVSHANSIPARRRERLYVRLANSYPNPNPIIAAKPRQSKPERDDLLIPNRNSADYSAVVMGIMRVSRPNLRGLSLETSLMPGTSLTHRAIGEIVRGEVH